MNREQTARGAAVMLLAGVLGACGGGTGPSSTPTASLPRTTASIPARSAPSAAPTSSVPASGTPSPTAPPAGAPPLGDPKACPLGALASAPRPVHLTFWHVESGVNAEAVSALVEQYNASQPDVRVDLVATDAEITFLPALRSGRLPDLLEANGIGFLQEAIDSKAIIPAGACLAADGESTADFLPRALSAYTVNGELWALPFSQNVAVLYYNPLAFEAAGLDPDQPPKTMDELRTMGAKIVASGYTHHGVSWVPNYGILSQLMSKAGHTLVDHNNGRSGRATHLTIDDPVGLRAFTMLREMVADGNAIVAADDGTGLLAVGSKDVAMAVGSASDNLGNILKATSEQNFPGVGLGVAPLPTLAVSDTGGSNLRGDPVYIVKGEDPARVEAAYRFALWLSEPAQQAALHVKTGSIPVRESVADLPEIKALWARDPLFRVGFDEVSSPGSPPGGGAAVIGPGRQIPDIVANGWTAAAKGEVDPRAAAEKITREVDAALAQYEGQLRAGG